MSTIASLLLAMDPEIKPWSEGMESVHRAERGRQLNQTGLIELAELKRQQEAQQLARQYYQQNPQALLSGDMPQSILASLQTAPGGPDRGGMSPPSGMPGQDPARYAAVSPQGGGPIPPDVARQVMPQVTPPGGMPGGPPQGALGPQPQPQANPQDRLMQLMRTNPDAAFQVMERQQQVQTQRLDMGAKVAGGIARIIQGVTDQGSLEQARQDVAMIDPRSAAQLPQFYSKEALEPFIKRAFTAQQTADVRLRTWQNQIEDRKNQLEEMKIGVQLTNAGFTGLGEGVTGILRGLTDEQVQQFGGRTSAKAIAYATEEEKKRKLGQAGEAERLKFELEEKQRATLPLQDARKEDAGLFVYKGTGQGVPGTIPYGQIKTLQDEKDPEKGVIKLGNLDEKKQLTTLKQLEPVLQQYKDLAEYAYGTDPKTGKKGPLADYQRGPFQTIGAMWNQLSQDDPVFQAKRRALQGQLQSVVRGLGARGDLNAQELEAATQMLANMDASLGLGLSLGPMVGTGGVGVGGSIKPSISLPDTPETGINIANELIGTVNRRIGSILQHEGYAKTPFIRIRTDQESEPKPGEMPRATPPPKAPPTPPPAAGPPIFPRPQIREPGAPAPAPGTQSQAAPAPAPATRPAPPTARSTPAQDEAYRQWQQQQKPPAPAPSAPATKPTPGRQSQAPTGTRLAGAPKYMNLEDVALAVQQTGRSRTEVEKAARSRGYVVYGSKLPLPEVTMVG